MKPAMEPSEPGVTARRAAVVVAGHRGQEAVARAGLVDPAPPVRLAALGALERLGVLSDDEVAHGLVDPAGEVRRQAAELAGGHPVVDLVPVLDDPDPSVVEMAAWALGEQRDARAVPRLTALAETVGGHPDPLCREAAVAALGAIGDHRGLAAVLGALDDKPAIRRRAAVALAAFEGPAVDDALRRCLLDRDWQVREVAEILTADDRPAEDGEG